MYFCIVKWFCALFERKSAYGNSQILLVKINVYFSGFGLKCFECDNNINPACGVYFKSYQFMPPSECWGYVKCGLQRQQPLKDDKSQPYTGEYFSFYHMSRNLTSMSNIYHVLTSVEDTDGLS